MLALQERQGAVQGLFAGEDASGMLQDGARCLHAAPVQAVLSSMTPLNKLGVFFQGAVKPSDAKKSTITQSAEEDVPRQLSSSAFKLV